MQLRTLFLRHVAQTSRQPMMLEIARAEGMYLYPPEGQPIMDLISTVMEYGYTAFFLEAGILNDIHSFDPELHHAGGPASETYVNNFVFLPRANT